MGFSSSDPSVPKQIIVHTESALLELVFDEYSYRFPFEFLRVLSPSAEVQGHGHPILQVGKKQVQLKSVEPVGHYALRLVFSDGHDSGIYSWAYFKKLGEQQASLWQDYLIQLEQARASREPT